jgi:probable F420-dependent oxidoreductase
MQAGIALRTMGTASQPDVLRDCARAGEQAGLDHIWVQDHVAIPPDDAEGSGGRYMDPLATLAYLAAATTRIGLGTGVLVLPYRPALPTLKWIATIQELSAGRLQLGVGVGWMKAEFNALGVSRRERGARTDACLDLLVRCFASSDDVVAENGQDFLFRPHPPRPPVLIGGAPPHSFERAVRYGDGWMPMMADPAKLAPSISELTSLFAEAGRGTPEVIVLGGISRETQEARDHLAALEEVGVTGFIAGARYETASEFQTTVDALAAARG